MSDRRVITDFVLPGLRRTKGAPHPLGFSNAPRPQGASDARKSQIEAALRRDAFSRYLTQACQMRSGCSARSARLTRRSQKARPILELLEFTPPDPPQGGGPGCGE